MLHVIEGLKPRDRISIKAAENTSVLSWWKNTAGYFSLTSVIDNVHMLMCMNDKFSLTGTSFTSPICWCEGINKFSLASFHSSQQYNYTAY